jgi:lipopolysaccharide transport system ATP-binding protein
MKPAIEVKHLSKKFKIDRGGESYLSLRDSFRHIFKKKSKEDFYALQDINFTVNEGESVGIIGKNGAGKSTLLKIISKITPPTEGSIIYRGRVASLLEVGTGFHGELTGRENVFMNGSILGMRKAEIKKNFDAIVDFAGVDKFIDTPLKHYSSGMQLRLAFAVAAFLENEILIIDEVLAVGDTEFQKKCIGKMDEVSKSGRTLLFVSHQLSVVSSLCKSGLLLAGGKIAFNGTADDAIAYYMEHVEVVNSEITWDATAGNDFIQPVKAVVYTNEGGSTQAVPIGQPFCIEFTYQVLAHGPCPRVNFHIFMATGEAAFVTVDHTVADSIQPGIYASKVYIPDNFLNEGIYKIGVAISTMNPVMVHFSDYEALRIEVIDDLNAVTRGGYTGKIKGAVRPLLQWNTQKIE